LAVVGKGFTLVGKRLGIIENNMGIVRKGYSKKFLRKGVILWQRVLHQDGVSNRQFQLVKRHLSSLMVGRRSCYPVYLLGFLIV
jgi:hypothetical protein